MRFPRTVALAGACTVLAAVAQTAQSSPDTFGAPYGGFAAFHGLRLASLPKEAPANKAVRYRGPQLRLAQAYVGHQGAEPTLGVDRGGAVFTVASAFDVLPGNPVDNVPKTLVYRSLDGGRTFVNTQPSVSGVNSQQVTTDPYVYVDPPTGRVFDVDLQGVNGAHMSYSDDRGATWTESALTTAGANDHQTVVAGPPPEGFSLPLLDPEFQRIVYYCTNGVAYGSCARSLDGGHTFTQADQTGYLAVNPGYAIGGSTYENKSRGTCFSLHGHAITDRAGRLFIPRGYCSDTMIAISTDAATTFTDVKVSNIPMTGEQASVAADSQGNLYYVFFDAKYALPWLTTSRDHGMTWSTPLMVAPPGVTETNFPVIDAGDPGRIAITFPGSTFQDGRKDKTRPWNSYVVVSTNALSANPLFLSNIANPKDDPVHRGDCSDRCAGMFDFLDVLVSPTDQGRVFATAVDTCTTMASCSTKRVKGNDNTSGSSGAAVDMQDVIIREVSGPALRGSGWVTHDSRR